MSQVSVDYRSKAISTLALENVSLEIPSSGYTLGLVGESGSGKTTLGLSILNIIEQPGKITSGRINYKGKNVLDMSLDELRAYRWQEVAMIYQSAMNSLNPVKKISDPIIEVITEHTGSTKEDARERTYSLLSEVGIKSNRFEDYPHELSGGMRQRVVIALALALSPKLLIADEPTSALDVVVQKQIISLLKREIRQRSLSLLFITHEISLLSGLVDHVAVMFGGEIVELGSHDDVLFEPLHPYTEMLLSSILTKDLASEKSEFLESLRPAPANSCKYSTRCKYAFERCKTERPVLTQIGNGRWVSCHKYT
jgi:peptide/nickel transport system ATP-binding protein